jgi:hypothetical protein
MLLSFATEQCNFFAQLAQSTAIHVEPSQESRLAQHDAKKRNGRTLLSKGAAQIDPKVEKLGTISQSGARFSIHAFNPRAGHMRIDQRQSESVDHFKSQSLLEFGQLTDLSITPLLLLNFVASAQTTASQWQQVAALG